MNLYEETEILGELMGLGASRPPREGVRIVQKRLNAFAAEMRLAEISEDGIWGCDTNTRLIRTIAWYSEKTGNNYRSRGNAGPIAAILFFTTVPLIPRIMADDLADAEVGYMAWLAAGKPCGGTGKPTDIGTDAEAAAAEAEAARIAAGGGGDLATTSGVGRYALFAAGGLVLALGLWWVWKRRQGR
ncbi:hypothetical protein KKI24_31500 [bacterium]|nr:hypothetical protein [bacterium]